jgi:hypothetical protein
MKTLLLSFVPILLVSFVKVVFVINSNPNNTLAVLERAFAEADSKKICAHIDNKILLEINNSESVFSKSQAEIILKDFFDKNKPKSFKVNSKSITKENYAMIGTLSTETDKNFRVSVKLREVGNVFVLDKISINLI